MQHRFDTYREEAEKVYKLFTPNQLRRVTTGKQTNWADEDVSTAMAIYSAGPKSYKLLRQKGHPYPAPSTLRKWARKVDIKPGAFLKPVLPLLQNKGDGDWSKYCVISFDEMKVKRCFEFDRAEKRILSPADYCLVYMVSGLFQKWQQVVYFGFRDDTSKKLWDLIIENVEKCGLIPVGAVCDMGPKNQGLWKDLGVDYRKPYYLTPNNNKVFFFADVPHLLKLTRNHLIDSGFKLEDGGIVNRAPLDRLVQAHNGRDLHLCVGIGDNHFPPKSSPKRQKVKYAAQLLSDSVYAALHSVARQPEMPNNTIATANFIKVANDWFDVMNVGAKKIDSRPTRQAYGLQLARQDAILDEMISIMETMEVIIDPLSKRGKAKKTKTQKRSLVPFQRGIIQSSLALKGLFNHLKTKLNTKFILTRRLNQDILERMFGYLRAKGGGLHDHPSPLELKYRIRASIVGG